MITTRDPLLQIFVFCRDGLAPQVLMPPVLHRPSEHLIDVNNLTGAPKHSGSHDTGNVIIILPFWGLLDRFLISLFQ
ncbi:hypothetical protein CY35_12G005100 [Sphagnum magellanicum]|nr:hypothetical protein CY35_12G005100 [Sphagnum magellanicum]